MTALYLIATIVAILSTAVLVNEIRLLVLYERHLHQLYKSQKESKKMLDKPVEL